VKTPISVTGNNRRTAGFTLIELMVVLVIVGLASAAVVLAIPDPSGRVRDEAERLAARALAVRDDAIIEGRSTRLLVDSTHYSAERRLSGRWQPYDARGLGAVALPAGITAATGEAGRIVVTFDATGGVDEATAIDLAKGTTAVRVEIPATGAARVAS
jgi:type II secretion system protein H